MGQALYRTYRPLKLSEVVGQEHVTAALMHALEGGTVSHAYLFTGPRGVGKTSVARILAHEVNGLPYDEERMHLDIIEIDAASNRRIDEIRDLRDKVHIAPTSAKYKVYIIDEVHMLTREAFNALLKTLEEPPAHVVFILATTEVYKLPETIISRTQRYTFKPVPLAKVVEHLKHIAAQESITAEPAALGLIAEHGEGSFRDSISLLDQVRNTKGGVTLKGVQAALGIAPAGTIEALYENWTQQNPAAIVQALEQAKEQGYEAARLAKQISERVRQDLLGPSKGVIDARNRAIRLLTKLIQVPAALDPRAFLEVALLDTALPRFGVPTESITNDDSPRPAKTGSSIKKEPSSPAAGHKTKSSASTAVTDNPATAPSAASAIMEKQGAHTQIKEKSAQGTEKLRLKHETALDPNVWPQILAQVKQNYNTLYSVLKAAQVEADPDVIRLKFSHAFHQKRSQDAKNRQIVNEIAQAVSGRDVKIEYVVASKDEAEPQADVEPPAAPALTQTQAPRTDLTPLPPTAIDAINNIFGRTELLES